MVQNRDEFIDCSIYDIDKKLSTGLGILKSVQKKIDTFIPPFNRIPQLLVDRLVHHNFKYITTGAGYDGHPYGPVDFKGLIPVIPKSKFYGRSINMVESVNSFSKGKDHLALHLTWELEDWQKGHRELEIVLDKLA